MNRQLKLPPQMNPGFAQIISLTETELECLVKALEETSPNLNKSRFVSSITKQSGLDTQKVSEVMRVLISLYVGRDSENADTLDFVDAVIEALERDKDAAKPPNGDWQKFRERLTQLMRFDQSVGVTAKAIDVMTDQPRVFVTGRNRILTELRPIYANDVDDDPTAAVIVHQLKISYMENDAIKEFYVALDSSDIRELHRLLVRAEAKEKSLLSFVKESGIEILIPPQE